MIGDYETKLAEPLSNPAALMTKLIAEIGYAAELRRNCKTAEEAAERESNVGDILRDLGQFLKRSTKGLRGFLDEVILDQEREEEAEEEELEKKSGVTLITMHAAKGLEFKHVYLIGLEEGILPHDRSRAEGSIDEERRLLYVGITRAMRTLTLSHCRTRTKYGSVASCAPSSFHQGTRSRIARQHRSAETAQHSGRRRKCEEPLRPNARRSRRLETGL